MNRTSSRVLGNYELHNDMFSEWINELVAFVCARAGEKGESAHPGGRRVDSNRNQIKVPEWTKTQSPQRRSLPPFSFLFQEPLDSHAVLGCVFGLHKEPIGWRNHSRICQAPTLHEWHFWELWLGTVLKVCAHRVWGWFTVHENAINTQEALEKETERLCRTSTERQEASPDLIWPLVGAHTHPPTHTHPPFGGEQQRHFRGYLPPSLTQLPLVPHPLTT